MGVNTTRLDPTRTTMLRRSFVADMQRRCARIRRAVVQLVDTEDAFGLKRADTYTTPQTTAITHPTGGLVGNARWEFATDDKKIEAYQQWLKAQVDQNLLTVDAHNKGTPWLQPYIGTAYKKGVERAYTDTTTAPGEDLSFIAGGKAAFMKMSFEGPVMQSKLKTLTTRAYTNLKGVTADMDKQMTTILATGLAKGTGAKQLAKQLADSVDGLSAGRAATIARTEIIHAHNEGQLDSFEAMNKEDVGVMAEWSTAHDGQVCPLCAPLEGVVLKIAEARGLLPRHPNCRCCWIPAGVGEDADGTTETDHAGEEQGKEEPGTKPTGKTTGQVWSKDEIGARIRASLQAESPGLGTVAARAESTWAGADVGITGKLKPGSKAYAEKVATEKVAAQQAATAAKAEAEKAAAARAAVKAEKLKAALEKEQAEAAAAKAEAEKVAAAAAKEKAAQEAAVAQAEKVDAVAKKAGGWFGEAGADVGALDHADYSNIPGWGPPEDKLTQSYGTILFDNKGRVLMREPKKHYGGAHWTFAKGGGTQPGTTALKELGEETGYKGSIHDILPGAFKGTKTKTNYFIGRGVGYDAGLMDGETVGVKWMTLDEAKAAIALSKDAEVAARDTEVLLAAFNHVATSDGAALAGLEANGKAALKATQDAANAAAHSHKVKTGMAQKHFAKDKFGGGITDGDYAAATKQKLGPTGLNKVLSEKGWHLSTLPGGTAEALTQADDIVAQKAILDGLKKAPKGVLSPPTAPAVGAAPTTPTSSFKVPLERDLKKVKDLPGSTKPYLAKDATTGKQWVVKDVSGSGINPAHLRSEANADELYRTLGFAVPKSTIIESASGPMKVSEYLDGGQTLASWKAGKSKAEIEAMYKEIRKGYVADALFANHDVAGMSYDNIFIHNGKPYRIDNGGALTFRAQGGTKPVWGPKVTDLKSMLDKGTNPVTASIYDGITDDEVHSQIRHIVANREKLLAAVEDDKTRAVLAARIDDLEAKLPAQAAPKPATGGQGGASTGITTQTPQRVAAARVNGHNIAVDRADIEDNNVLAWEELDAHGKPVTHLQLKVTKAGSEKINETLGDEIKAAKVLSPTANTHPDDVYYHTLVKVAKTVNTHAKDPAKYNAATMGEFKEMKKTLANALLSAPEGDKKKMLEHYEEAMNTINKAIAEKKTTAKHITQFEYKPDLEVKPVAAASRLRRDIRVRRDNVVDFRTATFDNGNAKAVQGGKNKFSTNQAYTMDMGEGITVNYLPNNGSFSNDSGRALHGTVRVTVPAKATAETLHKAMGMLKEIGVDTAAPAPAYEESLYLHKGVYLNKKAEDAGYQAIWRDKTLTDAERVVAQKKWIKDNMGIDVEKVPSYNPAGKTKNPDGSGIRHWERWDLPAEKIQKEMKGYTLTHSPSTGVERTLAGVLDSGGEFTSTTGRIRKGVDVGSTGGMSSHADVNTGGASYFFTRIKEAKDDTIGFHFKIDNLARLDTVSYGGDKYGAISEIGSRATTTAQYKAFAAKNHSNETLFKEGLSLGDLENIVVHDANERHRVLQVFKDRGVTVLPDGRSVSDLVITREQKYRANIK